MNEKKIIGRETECARLRECIESDSAQLVIVYGRRRVGKTYLINNFFDYDFAFKITGMYNRPKEDQLEIFMKEYRRKAKLKETVRITKWLDAFDMLRDYLESLDTERKQVVFFDEMPWLDNQKSDFLPAFEWFWNDWASTRDNLIFIVCGSATSWMNDKIAANKGGLFNRQTMKLFLKPFNLYETELFLKKKGITWSRYEIAECYMIMGGIPYYLNSLTPELGLKQNIDRLFFDRSGELWDEFSHLYATLFSNSPVYIKVVEVLSRRNRGMTREELSRESELPGNGTLTKILNDLELSGFIRITNFYRKAKKNQVYQLSDYYTAFYFRYLSSNHGLDSHFWSNSIDNPSKRAWTGFAFESLTRDHILQIKQKLGISGVLTEESTWFIPAEGEDSGAQIDLIIDRRDNVVNLCEMKYSINEFMIDKDYDRVLRNKISSFINAAPKSKSIQLTMVTTFGVKRNMYSGLVQSEVVLDDLFAPAR